MESSAPAFRMYPRGFLGGFPPPQVERERTDIAQTYLDHSYRVNIVRPADPSTYPNKEIELLYNSYIGKTIDSHTKDFRKRVLKAALRAFGTQRFDHWYLAQLSSLSYDENHGRFLDDTLNFISGKRREMSPMTWAGLIEMANGSVGQDPPSETAKQYFQFDYLKQSGTLTDQTRFTMANTIQAWCSRPNGFDDMLCTLHVLFGSY